MKSRLCVSFVVLLGVIIAVSVGIYFKSFKPFSDLEASDISKIYDISYGYPEYALNENQIKTLAELLNKVVLRKTIVSKDGYDGGDLGFRIEYNDGTSIVVSNRQGAAHP